MFYNYFEEVYAMLHKQKNETMDELNINNKHSDKMSTGNSIAEGKKEKPAIHLLQVFEDKKFVRESKVDVDYKILNKV